MFLLEILVEDKDTSFIIGMDTSYDKLVDILPFNTELSVWKEEVYFQIPIELEGSGKYYRVKPGKVYYWSPGRAFCIFYGLSEPYTPVSYVGEYVGPLNILRYFDNGDRALVKEHVIYDELIDVVKRLSSRGYFVGTPIEDGVRIIVASKYIGSCRIGFRIYIEDYGYHLETEPLFKYDESFQTKKIMYSLKNVVSERKYLRIDLSEEEYVVLTTGVNKLDELLEAIKELEETYPTILNTLQYKHV